MPGARSCAEAVEGHRPALRLHSRAEFARRVARFVAVAAGFLAVALGIGVLGYHELAGLGWVDSFLNAAMILGGMGPVDPMPHDAAKLFAGIYALVGGAVYPAVAALILYPLVHRMMAVLHIRARAPEEDE
ncbi:hypothetical protein GT358_00180 [Rubellimicrobium sp. CFH 75288]|nr:hypothetical protein [Rubellimicrobium sp. CFH 75288]